MAFLLKTVKTIRNNWKKSTFAAIILSTGLNWTKSYFDGRELMRLYCQAASNYGQQSLAIDKNPKTATVILNPNANNRKAVSDFEKYCAPILHLAGFLVNVVKTESVGHAKELIQNLNSTDVIVVAGGDGTLSEVVTGLLRRTEENSAVSIGVLPLGKNNSLANCLFPGDGRLKHIKSLGDASMAIVTEYTKKIDVMKVQVIEASEEPSKAIYALSGLKWGAFRDADVSKDKYWFFGPLRSYATYLFNGYKNNLTWRVDAAITYSPPCNGCRNCAVTKNNNNKKWYQRYSQEKSQNVFTNILNPDCEIETTKNIETVDFTIATSNVEPTKSDIPKLHLNIGPKNISYWTFVSQGWKSIKGKERDVIEKLDARVIEINPVIESSDQQDSWFSIDNENFEIKSIKITLLPQLITMFCKKNGGLI